MKKLLLSLLTLLTCSIGFASASTVLFDIKNCTISENGGTEQAFTGFSSLSSGAVISDLLTINNDITISTNGKYYSNKSGKTIRVYSGNNLEIAGATGIILTNIEINFSNNPFKGNVYTKKEGEELSTSGTPYNQTNNGTPYTWSAQSSDAINAVKFNHGGSVAYISKITITYEDGQGGGGDPDPGLKEATLAFADASLDVKVGETVDGLALTKPEDNTGVVTYTSSDDAIATVNAETGAVTGVAAGTVTITATSTETDIYKAGEASYTLTVIDPNAPVATGAMFDFTTADLAKLATSGIAASSAQTADAANNLTGVTLTKDGVTISFADGSQSNKPRWWKASDGTELRIYTGNTMTVTAPANMKLTSIEFTKGSNNFALGNGYVGGIDDNNVWTPATLERANTDVKKVTFTPTGRTYIDKITVNYECINTGVDDILSDDANAPVEYYNLQGVRVANPESGLYIRVQGKKASKVLVK